MSGIYKDLKNDDGACFPVGMRVLAVEDNIVCRTNLVNVLEKCRYKVTAATEASEALKLLRQHEEKFDIVISNVDRQGIDGFKLLEIINLEMDIPVVLVSARDDRENVMKGMKSGASAYLVKPVRAEEMKNIWQHVVRRNLSRSDKSSITTDVADRRQTPPREVKDYKNAKVDDEDPFETPRPFEDESSTRKKPRVLWTPDLNIKFLRALQHLGEKDAVPNKILKFMDEPGLTRDNIASHLQKYRNNMKKQNARGGQQDTNMVITSSHRSHDSEMNSRTLIQSLNSSSNYMMNLMSLQIPTPTNQARHIQHPNLVGKTRFSLAEYPFSSTGNCRPPSDFRPSIFPTINKGVSFYVDEPNVVWSSQTVRNGGHLQDYLNSIEHYQTLCGGRCNSTHPFSASSASETGAFYQQQNPYNFPSMNIPARNLGEEDYIYYNRVGDSNNGASCINFPSRVHGQENKPSFQQSRVQQGEVISFEADGLENIPL